MAERESAGQFVQGRAIWPRRRQLITNTWDLENRNTKIQLPGAVVNTFTYDGDGSRRRIEDSAGLRNLICGTRWPDSDQAYYGGRCTSPIACV